MSERVCRRTQLVAINSERRAPPPAAAPQFPPCCVKISFAHAAKDSQRRQRICERAGLETGGAISHKCLCHLDYFALQAVCQITPFLCHKVYNFCFSLCQGNVFLFSATCVDFAILLFVDFIAFFLKSQFIKKFIKIKTMLSNQMLNYFQLFLKVFNLS